MATRSANRQQFEPFPQPLRPRQATVAPFAGAAGAIAGAALGGAALAIAANLGRKFLTQSLSASQGNWADSLAAEHEAGAGDLRQDAGDRPVARRCSARCC